MKKTYELISLIELSTRFKVGDKVVPVCFNGGARGLVRRNGRFTTDDPKLQEVMEEDSYFNTKYLLLQTEESEVEKAKRLKALKEIEKEKLAQEEQERLAKEAQDKIEKEAERSKMLEAIQVLKDSLETSDDKEAVQVQLDNLQKEFDAKFPQEVIDHPEIKTVSDMKEFLIGLNIDGVNDETLINKTVAKEIGLQHFHSFSKVK